VLIPAAARSRFWISARFSSCHSGLQIFFSFSCCSPLELGCSVAVLVVSHAHKDIHRRQRTGSLRNFSEESGCPIWFFSPRVLPSQGIFCLPRSDFLSCEQSGTPARKPSLSSWSRARCSLSVLPVGSFSVGFVSLTAGVVAWSSSTSIVGVGTQILDGLLKVSWCD
jgi:hypothetical protein